MSYKSFVSWILVQVCAVAAGIIVLLYVYDPLQLYHKPYFREPTFSTDTRVQNKGIIKNYDFTDYVLGTSMLQNTLASDLQEALGGSWVNISMAASSFDERAVILRYLFLRKKPKHIIYSLDHFSLIDPKSKGIKSFDYLYDENPFNDFKIYLNNRFLSCALRLSSNPSCVGRQDLDTLGAWIINKEGWIMSFGQDLTELLGGFENWVRFVNPNVASIINRLKDYDGAPFEKASENLNITQAQEYFHTYLLDFIQKHPETRFSLIVPPYSLLHWRMGSGRTLRQWQQAVTWLVEQVENLPNATIYGFDDLFSYTADIANYLDSWHYNIDMNRIFINAIKNGEHILTPKNIHTYLQDMEERVASYDLAPLAAIAKHGAQETSKEKSQKP